MNECVNERIKDPLCWSVYGITKCDASSSLVGGCPASSRTGEHVAFHTLYNLQALVPALTSQFAKVSGVKAGTFTVCLLPTSSASALFFLCTLPGCRPQITPRQCVPCSQPEGCQVLREQATPPTAYIHCPSAPSSLSAPCVPSLSIPCRAPHSLPSSFVDLFDCLLLLATRG